MRKRDELVPCIMNFLGKSRANPRESTRRVLPSIGHTPQSGT